MKKVVFILLLSCGAASAQKITPSQDDKIILHLEQQKGELKTGKSFIFTGIAIAALGPAISLTKTKKSIELSQSLSLIGWTFSLYGFMTVAVSQRHTSMIASTH